MRIAYEEFQNINVLKLFLNNHLVYTG